MLGRIGVKTAVIAMSFMASLTIAPFALAQSQGGGIGGKPANPDPKNKRTQSIFIYDIDKNQTKKDQVLVVNNTSKKQVIQLHTVDGMTTNTGAYTCRQNAEETKDVGSWLTLDKNEVIIEPNQSEKVGFTLTVPGDADIGEHNGCIALQAKDEASDAAGGVKIRTRQAIRVVATVPGDLNRKVTISNFATEQQSGKQKFDISLKNEGNVSADVDTKVVLKGLFGKTHYENGGSYPVMSDNELDLNFTDDSLPFWGGIYFASGSITYDKKANTLGVNTNADIVTEKSDKKMVFVMPSILAIAAVVAVIIAIAFGMFRMKRGRNKRGVAFKGRR